MMIPSQQELKNNLLRAVQSKSAYEELVNIIHPIAQHGCPQNVVLEILEGMRKEVTREQEDVILEVMDRVAGWCIPSQRIYPDSER